MLTGAHGQRDVPQQGPPVPQDVHVPRVEQRRTAAVPVPVVPAAHHASVASRVLAVHRAAARFTADSTACTDAAGTEVSRPAPHTVTPSTRHSA